MKTIQTASNFFDAVFFWHALWFNKILTYKTLLIMKNTKKLPTKQLEKFSNIFTQLGLVLVLFIVYVTLEHQTEEKTVAVFKPNDSDIVYIEPDQDVIFQKEVKIKPKIEVLPTKKIILDKVEKGDNDIVETIIDIPTENPEIIDIDNLIEIKEPPIIIEDVDFVDIQNAPVFKGCEGLSKEKNKVCFDKKMKQFVHRNFNAGLANELGLRSGKHRISSEFLIDDKGFVVDVKISAPHKQLEKETSKLIKKLPKFTPGKQRNKPVRVRYTLPITFIVE